MELPYSGLTWNYIGKVMFSFNVRLLRSISSVLNVGLTWRAVTLQSTWGLLRFYRSSNQRAAVTIWRLNLTWGIITEGSLRIQRGASRLTASRGGTLYPPANMGLLLYRTSSYFNVGHLSHAEVYFTLRSTWGSIIVQNFFLIQRRRSEVSLSSG